MSRIQVVVIGGGYAGTLAANYLRLQPDIDVTVVSPQPVFNWLSTPRNTSTPARGLSRWPPVQR